MNTETAGESGTAGSVVERLTTGRRGVAVLFVVTSVAFGTGFVGIKAGLDSVPPVLFAAVRFDVGAAVLLTFVLARRGYWRPRTRSDVAAVLVAAVFLSGINGALLFVGQQFVTSGTAAVMYGLAPVLAPAVAAVVLPDQRFDPLTVVGLFVGLAGLVVVVGPATLAGSLGGGDAALGQLLVAGAAVNVAVGSVLLRRVGRSMPGLSMTAWALALAAVGLHAASLAVGESPTAVVATPRTAAAALWVGLPATALAFPAYYALIDRAGPVRANLVSYSIPVVATVTGAAVLGEPVPLRTVAGFGVILAGFALVERANLSCEVRKLLGRPAERTDEHVCERMPRG